jgi:hypothetical protein
VFKDARDKLQTDLDQMPQDTSEEITQAGQFVYQASVALGAMLSAHHLRALYTAARGAMEEARRAPLLDKKAKIELVRQQLAHIVSTLSVEDTFKIKWFFPSAKSRKKAHLHLVSEREARDAYLARCEAEAEAKKALEAQSSDASADEYSSTEFPPPKKQKTGDDESDGNQNKEPPKDPKSSKKHKKKSKKKGSKTRLPDSDPDDSSSSSAESPKKATTPRLRAKNHQTPSLTTPKKRTMT